MVLVGYSDSEGSDSESGPTPKPAPKPSATATSRAPQKLVDRANPSKIVISLPKTSSASKDTEKDGPPAKKQRTGGFGGFNAMLPTPKRTGVVGGGIAAAASGGAGAGANGLKRGLGRGLGVGVNLKTGAAPAFSRDAVEEQDYDEAGNPIAANRNIGSSSDARTTTTSAINESRDDDDDDGKKVYNEAQEVKLVGKPMMFKPLSVMNKAKKKKTTGAIAAASAAAAVASKAKATGASAASSQIGSAAAAVPAAKPKVSLFSVESDEPSIPVVSSSSGEYQPILHVTEKDEYEEEGDVAAADSYTSSAHAHQSAPSYSSSGAGSGRQTLDNIASDLHLTASQRRQLFGRNAPKDLSAINLVNFNTDAEYAHNEELRAAGETVQHNPVRAIAPGKHSLQQLVNAATSQKDALEEHFASGRKNKKEAGSKYGW